MEPVSTRMFFPAVKFPMQGITCLGGVAALWSTGLPDGRYSLAARAETESATPGQLGAFNAHLSRC